MNKVIFLFCILCTPFLVLNAQVAISSDGSTPHPNAMLDVQSDSKGMLVPRMTSAQREIITSPIGLLVFDTSTSSFWFRDDASWVELISGAISTLSDIDGDTKIQVEEDSDDDIIRFDINGNEALVVEQSSVGRTYLTMPGNSNNISIGSQSGINNTATNARNLFIGNNAGQNSSTGASNIVLGHDAGKTIGTGNSNIIIGVGAATGPQNPGSSVIIGKQAAFGASSISSSVIVGNLAGQSSSGSGNVFIGNFAGNGETDGKRLHINYAQGATPLIYGEFDNRYVKIDGDFNIGNKYTFPNTAGSSGMVLKHNGTNTLEWSQGNSNPIGTIQMWPTATPPDGWLICDGSAITAANYPDLVGIIGTSLPDFNGRFALGSGENTTDFPTNHSLGSTGGQEKVALNAAQIPPHDHDVAITYREGEENGSGNSYSDLGGGSTSSKTFTTDSWGGNGGATQSHENMPPFLTINYIIKAE